MLKYMSLVMRQIYPHKKQIKTDYEVQFTIDPIWMIKLEKFSIKKNSTSQLKLSRKALFPGYETEIT